MAILQDLRAPSSDPTQQDLRLALLDQHVEGTYGGRPHCYVAVLQGSRWTLGVAVEGEKGYSALKYPEQWVEFAEAKRLEAGMNDHIGVTNARRLEIVTSTMRGRR